MGSIGGPGGKVYTVRLVVPGPDHPLYDEPVGGLDFDDEWRARRCAHRLAAELSYGGDRDLGPTRVARSLLRSLRRCRLRPIEATVLVTAGGDSHYEIVGPGYPVAEFAAMARSASR